MLLRNFRRFARNSGRRAYATSSRIAGSEEVELLRRNGGLRISEIIEGNGHDFAVDWWCLGVVLYEMLYGKTPFRGQNRKETFYRILFKPPELFGEPTALRDLIGRLLEKDPTKRITGKEIRHHEFFRGVRWETVVDLERPPFIPEAVPVWEEVGEGIDVEKVVEEIFVDAHGLKGKSRSVDNGT
ncbi:hypothetical protein HPP92_023381 [Vanilla planifolia]|uniref:non-specific serine/threonine protein kinase n=1 Tax=Vanilla planifolia TaxID=51239 RepID=A0A835UGB1_VANPL|nr:hypothetical protein HPP92_023381 [Vanilla planifolia]